MKKNWMQNVKSNGATRKRLGVKKGEKVTISQLNNDMTKQKKQTTKKGTMKPSALKKFRQDDAAKKMINASKKRAKK